jgi:condensin complex subunit 3
VDGPSSRFTIKLIKHLLSGSSAKDKSVRYRIIQTLSILLNSLGEIDDDLYEPLRTTFVARANDKEPTIRVQAILGLAKLMGGEDDEDLDEDEPSLKEIVLDMMRFDPAAEVRRIALYHLPLQPETIDHILARSRDVDATLRKVLYSNILNNKNIPDMRVLTIGQREELIKNGLGDREPSVRNAAGAMISGWLGGDDSTEGGAERRAVDKLVDVRWNQRFSPCNEIVNCKFVSQFLGRFDLTNPQTAEDALLSLLESRRELVDDLEFQGKYSVQLRSTSDNLTEFCIP